MSLRTAVGGLGAGLAALSAGGLAKSISAAADFDAKMTESLAIMGDVSKAMREDMAAAAREVGRTTQFSADQAAEAYFFLASAGLDAKESIAAMPTVANFAQAGMLDMATATDIVTDAASALGMEMKNLGGLTDQLVKANTLANASVEQFGTALTNKAAPAMKRLGVQTEEGIAALSVFADQGLKGERAGTILARTLGQLNDKAISNSKAFQELGIQVFDNEGNMRSLQAITEDLEGALGDMSVKQRQAALQQLGFNRRAMQGIDLLLGNSDALAGYTKELENAGGAAETVAKKQLKNLNQQFGLLIDNLTDIAIPIGGVFLPALTGAMSALVTATQRFAKWNESMNGIPGAVALISGLIGGLTTAFVALSPQISAVASLLAGTFIPVLVSVITPVTAVMTAVSLLAAAFREDFAGIATTTNEVLAALKQEFTATAKTLKSVFAPALGAAAGAFETFRSRAERAIRPVVDLVGTQLVGGIQSAGSRVRGELRKLAATWQAHRDRVLGTVRGTWDKIEQEFGLGLSAIEALLNGRVDLAKTMFSLMMLKAKATVAMRLDEVEGTIGLGLSAIEALLNDRVDVAKAMFSLMLLKAKATVRTRLDELKAVVGNKVGELKPVVKEKLKQVATAAPAALSKLKTKLPQPIQTAIDEAKKPIGDLVTAFQDAKPKILNAIQPLTQPLQKLGEKLGYITKQGKPTKKSLAGVALAISGLSNPITTAMGLVVGLSKVWDSNLFSIRDTTEQALGRVRTVWETEIQPLVDDARRIFSQVADVVSKYLTWILENSFKPILNSILQLWETHGDELLSELVETWEALTQRLQALMDVIVPIIKTALDAIIAFWNEFGDEILAVTKFAFDAIGSVINTALDLLFTAIQVGLNLIQGDWDEAWDAMAGFLERTFDGILNFVTKWGSGFLDYITGLLADIYQGFVDWANDLIWGSLIPEMLSDILSEFETWATDTLARIQTWISNVTSDIVAFFNDWKQKLQSHISAVWTKFDEMATSVKNRIQTWITNTTSDIVSFFSDWKTKLQSHISTVWTKFDEMAISVKNRIQTWITNVTSLIKDFFKDFSSYVDVGGAGFKLITTAFDNLIAWVEGIWSDFKTWLVGESGEGGLVDSLVDGVFSLWTSLATKLVGADGESGAIGGLAGDITSIFSDLKETLVGNSIVPDMLSDMLSEVDQWVDPFLSPFREAKQDAVSEFNDLQSKISGARSTLSGLQSRVQEQRNRASNAGNTVASEVKDAFYNWESFAPTGAAADKFDDLVSLADVHKAGLGPSVNELISTAKSQGITGQPPERFWIDNAPVTVHTGGKIGKEGLAMLDAGEHVLSESDVDRNANPPGGTTVVVKNNTFSGVADGADAGTIIADEVSTRLRRR